MSAENIPAGGRPSSMLDRLMRHRLAMITGKGGVGRTTVAAAMALATARAGRRVLLTEIGDQDASGYSHVGHQFGHDNIPSEPVELAAGLFACTLTARTGHELFLQTVLPVPTLVRAALRSKAVRKFLSAVPSFYEMGLFYHMLHLLRQQDKAGNPLHELMIIDMPATGHTLAITGLPATLLKLIPEGPITEELHAGLDIVNDPKQSAAWVVTLPEVLPVSECLELIEGLDDSETPVGGVVLNRLPYDPFTEEERAALEPLLAHAPTFGALAFERIAGARQAMNRLASSIDLPLVTVGDFSAVGTALVEAVAGSILQPRAAGWAPGTR